MRENRPRRRVFAAPAVVFILLAYLVPAAWSAQVADELIVRMKPGRSVDSVNVRAAVSGANIASRGGKHGLMRIKLPKGSDLPKSIAEYRLDPAVDYVGPNHILHIASGFVTPNDPIYSEGVDLFGDLGIFTEPQWGLYNDGNNNGYGGKFRADIHAPEAWSITTGSPDVVIAVLDTGLNYNHPDMAAKLWTNPGEIPNNGIDDDHNGYIDDVHGWNFSGHNNEVMDDHVEDGMEVNHGTFTSSIAAASTNNGEGIAGVAWACPVMPLKVMDSTGYGLESDVADAIYYAVDKGVKVLNLSLAGTDDVPALRDAIEYAWQHGSICICASGNEDVSTPSYPACYPHALAVGASNEKDQRCTATDWMSGGSNYGPYLDVVAPGNEILGCTNALDVDGYYSFPGTSAAAPFVAGEAALIWSLHPTWTNSQVFYQILFTADDIGAPGWDQETGWGRINAYRALTETVHTYTRVSGLKSLATSTSVVVSGLVLSTSSGEIPGRLYVQDSDGTAGICLYYDSGTTPDGFTEGDVVDIVGTIGIQSGERVIMNPTLTKTGSTTIPRPVMMTSSAMCGGPFGLQGSVIDRRFTVPVLSSSGLNNVGKLVTITGKVTGVYYNWFFIDDGCGLDDGSGYSGVYVYNGDLVRPQMNQYAAVTGISSCEYIPGSTTYKHRVLRPRRQSDIRVFAP